MTYITLLIALENQMIIKNMYFIWQENMKVKKDLFMALN